MTTPRSHHPQQGKSPACKSAWLQPSLQFSCVRSKQATASTSQAGPRATADTQEGGRSHRGGSQRRPSGSSPPPAAGAALSAPRCASGAPPAAAACAPRSPAAAAPAAAAAGPQTAPCWPAGASESPAAASTRRAGSEWSCASGETDQAPAQGGAIATGGPGGGEPGGYLTHLWGKRLHAQARALRPSVNSAAHPPKETEST